MKPDIPHGDIMLAKESFSNKPGVITLNKVLYDRVITAESPADMILRIENEPLVIFCSINGSFYAVQREISEEVSQENKVSWTLYKAYNDGNLSVVKNSSDPPKTVTNAEKGFDMIWGGKTLEVRDVYLRRKQKENPFEAFVNNLDGNSGQESILDWQKGHLFDLANVGDGCTVSVTDYKGRSISFTIDHDPASEGIKSLRQLEQDNLPGVLDGANVNIRVIKDLKLDRFSGHAEALSMIQQNFSELAAHNPNMKLVIVTQLGGVALREQGSSAGTNPSRSCIGFADLTPAQDHIVKFGIATGFVPSKVTMKPQSFSNAITHENVRV